jgi:hypothetical protein
MDQKQQLEQQLIEKAMKDETFRKLLVENPVAAIEAETGMKIPETITIKVLEEDHQSFYIILPAQKRESEDELTDAELEQIAGGYTGDTTCFADSWNTCNKWICE